jgi:hypothetical protein
MFSLNEIENRRRGDKGKRAVRKKAAVVAAKFILFDVKEMKTNQII